MLERKLFALLTLLFSVICYQAEAAELSEELQASQNGRYILLCSDEDFDYYIDRQSMKKIKHPYLKEDLLDVWIKIAENEDASYSYPENFGMLHYYARLKEPQLQLLQTVYIKGKVVNSSMEERPFREANWQAVVPDTAEEELYYAIIRKFSESDKRRE